MRRALRSITERITEEMNITEIGKLAFANAVEKGFYDRVLLADDDRNFTDMTYVDQVFAVRKNHRWLYGRIALFHSEVAEATEIARKRKHSLHGIQYTLGGKPEGFVIELADIIIRLSDAWYSMGGQFDPMDANSPRISVDVDLGVVASQDVAIEGVLVLLNDIHTAISGISAALPNSQLFKGGSRELADAMWEVVYRVVLLANWVGLDLHEAIGLKMDYNLGREYMHGKKA